MLISEESVDKTWQVGRNFVTYLERKLLNKELTDADLLEKFGISSFKDFKHDIQKGRKKLKIEYLCRAQELFGYNPAEAFGTTGYTTKEINTEALLNEQEAEYVTNNNKDLINHISSVLTKWMDKHKINKQHYSGRIGKSTRHLYKLMNGESRVFLDDAICIAQDLGESLDMFRNTPLPKGHMLQDIAQKELIIQQQKEIIELLKKQLQEK